MAEVKLEECACGVCGCNESKRLFLSRDYNYGNEGEWPVAECLECGTVFMNPRIPPSEIGRFYPSDYYMGDKGIHDPYRMTWRRAVKDEAAEKYYGYRIERRDPPHFRLLGMLMLPFTRRWTTTRKFLKPVLGGKMLDIGCGNGQWLSEYRRLGWDAWGVEPGEKSAKIAKEAGFAVFVGTLADAGFAPESFDAITMWDSLEHIPDPGDTMRLTFKLLKRGGTVHIAVPNFGSGWARRYRDKWYMFTSPVHYYHYTQKTIRILLEKSGYRSIKIEYLLGDVGLFETWDACLRGKALGRILRLPPVMKAIKAFEMLLPRGHLIAEAVKAE